MKARNALFVAAAVIAGALWFVGREAQEKLSSSSAAVPSVATNAVVGASSASALAAASAAAPSAAPKETALSARGTKTVRITSGETLTADLRRALAGYGARVIAPVGSRAAIVEASPAACARIARDSRFAAEDVQPAAKVQSALAALCAEQPDDRLPVVVVGLATDDVPAISAAIVAAGGELMKVPFEGETFGAKVSPALVADLAERGDVRWIEHAPPVRVMNDKSVLAGAANVETIRTVHKLFGRGQTVTVCDSGFDSGKSDDCHLDFAGRVKALLPEAGAYHSAGDYSGHGTHVSGTILGDGARSSGKYRGMAPKAQLVMECVGLPFESSGLVFNWSYERIFSEGYLAYGSYIHSDSWGTDDKGAYTTKARALDDVLWRYPELLVVVSAGNDGKNGDCTIGAPATAKSALTVGNTQSFRGTSVSWGLSASPENLNPTSSRGPTADGRVKPEISAPGTEIRSTLSALCTRSPVDGHYTDMTGTSMACPLVSGAAALTREWLLDRRDYAAKHGGKKPTGALLKAILTGGGVIMTGDYQDYGKTATRAPLPQTRPNFCTGWGRIDLEETLYPTNGRAVLFADRVPFAHQSVWTTNLTTTADAPLDVQLAWMDHPADVSTDTGLTLVNDLDLVVSNRTTGAVWYGNDVLGGDHTNTTESVRLSAENAPAGDYTVFVIGRSVPYDSTFGGAAAVYVRGAFPDETASDPLFVRNVRTEKRYEYLDEALAEIESGDTLELLQGVELAKSVTVAKSCTIVATNADPTASAVTRVAKATLAVAPGVTLSLSNVVFAEAGGTAVSVATNAALRVAGLVGVGLVATADAKGFVLDAPLSTTVPGITLDCAVAKERNAAFGLWTGDYLVASNDAAHVSHATDLELGGRAVLEGQTLVWDRVQPDPADALAYAEDAQQGRTYYRSLDTLLADYTNGGEIVICRDCEAARFTKSVMVKGALVVRSPSGAAVTPSETVRFTVPAGSSLVVSNVTFRDFKGERLFSVEGGDMTLADGARLENLRGASTVKTCGATYMSDGSFTMLSGSAIVGCLAVDNMSVCGAGLFAEGGLVRLAGGMVSGCRATLAGAGIFAWTTGETGARVEISGDFTARANELGELTPDGAVKSVTGTNDLYLTSATHPLAIVAPLTSVSGWVGIQYGSKNGGNAAGEVFATFAASVASDARQAAAARFRNTTPGAETLVAAVAGDTLVWQTTEIWPEGRVSETSPQRKFNIRDSSGYVRSWWTDLAKALPYVQDGDQIVFRSNYSLTNSITIPACNLTLRTPMGVKLSRARENVQIRIPAGAALTADAEFFDSYFYYGFGTRWHTKPFIDVCGGALTLENCYFSYFVGSDARDANAVTVWNGGRLVVRDTAFQYCENFWQPAFGVNEAAGAAILVDGATAEIADSTVTDCFSAGGGVTVANKGELRVKGMMKIIGNKTEDEIDRNLVVQRGSRLVVSGKLIGYPEYRIGYTEGTYGDTNVFGEVAWDWPDVTALTNSAACFVHDVTGARGMAVTNGVDKAAKLVWSDWLSRAGSFVDADGTVYRIFLAAGQHVASPEKYGTPTLSLSRADATASAANAGDATLTITITGVKDCWYTLQRADALARDADFTSVETKQAAADGPVAFTVKTDGTGAFWKVVAEEGLSK